MCECQCQTQNVRRTKVQLRIVFRFVPVVEFGTYCCKLGCSLVVSQMSAQIYMEMSELTVFCEMNSIYFEQVICEIDPLAILR